MPQLPVLPAVIDRDTVLDLVRSIPTPTDELEAHAVASLRDECKRIMGEIESAHNPKIRKAHADHKAALAAKRSAGYDVFKQAMGMCSSLLAAYDDLIEQQQREARQRQLDRLATQAEERIRHESSQALERARQAQVTGDTPTVEKALETIQERAEVDPRELAENAAGPLIVRKPKIAGHSIQTRKRWRVVEGAYLSRVKPEYLMLDEGKVGALVKRLEYDQDAINRELVLWEVGRISGKTRPVVECYEKKITVSHRKA